MVPAKGKVMTGKWIAALGAGLIVMGSASVATDRQSFDAPPAGAQRDAHARCDAQYPYDFDMRDVCERVNVEGAVEWQTIAARYANHPRMRVAIQNCRARFMRATGMDWEMAGVCARVQEEAFIRAGQR